MSEEKPKSKKEEVANLYLKIKENAGHCKLYTDIKDPKQVFGTEKVDEFTIENKAQKEIAKKNLEIKAESCYICPRIISEQELTKATFETMDWYKNFKEYIKKLRKSKQKEELKKDIYVLSKDPYEKDTQTSWGVRYFATLVHSIYPPDVYVTKKDEQGNEYKDYFYKFHIRGLFYRLIGLQACIPFKKGKGYALEKITKDDKFYRQVQNLVQNCRYADLIPYGQVQDYRVKEPIKTIFFPNVKKAVSDTTTGGLNVTIELSAPIKTEVQAPLVVLYSEKFELLYIFEELAQNYNIAYYVAKGESSLTAANEIYNFIKKYSQFALVLTCTDYDISGFQINVSLARKFQYLIDDDEDKEKPCIMVHKWLISPIEVSEIYEVAQKINGLPIEGIFEFPKTKEEEKEEEEKEEKKKRGQRRIKQKLEKKGEPRYMVELDALNLLIGKKTENNDYSSTRRLYDIYEIKLKKLFPDSIGTPIKKENEYIIQSPLIEKAKFDDIYKKELENYINKINEQLKNLESLPEGFIGVTNYEDYIKLMIDKIKATDYYQKLNTIISNTKYTPKDIYYKIKDIDTNKIDEFVEKMISDSAKKYKDIAQEPILKESQTPKDYGDITKALNYQKSYEEPTSFYNVMFPTKDRLKDEFKNSKEVLERLSQKLKTEEKKEEEKKEEKKKKRKKGRPRKSK
jgi:hypothetical protein